MTEAQEPTPQDDRETISLEEMLDELTSMLGEKDQQIAGQRIFIKRQQKLIEGLQEELTRKRD